MARRIKNKRLKFKCVVLGDGQTEQFYFKHLKEIKNYGYSIRPRFFENISLFDAEHIIDELLDGGCDKILYFTDYDVIVNQSKNEKKNQKEFDRIKNKYKEYGGKVIICESMPSIEFWFLLHYQYTTKAFQNAKEVESVLKKYIPTYSKVQRTFLNNKKWVELLCENNAMDSAIKNADKIMNEKKFESKGGHYPFTKVQKGIAVFEKLKKGGNKIK